jgi:hypothetical protein
MRTIRLRIAVLSGAAIGLIAGGAVYGAVSTASAATPTSFTKAATVSATHCAAGQELEHGGCVIHLEPTGDPKATSSSGVHATSLGDHDGAEHATNTAQRATKHTKHTKDTKDTKDAADNRG